jgi:hypothetical protein
MSQPSDFYIDVGGDLYVDGKKYLAPENVVFMDFLLIDPTRCEVIIDAGRTLYRLSWTPGEFEGTNTLQVMAHA